MSRGGKVRSAEELLDLAGRLLEARRVEAALEAYRDARRSGAEWGTCVAAEWQCLLLLSRYREAWELSDSIADREKDPARFWDRRPLAGKKVMLRCLHGYGDALQFIRYAPRICAEAESLCVETHPEMVVLLQACEGVREVVTWGDGAPGVAPVWDSQIEIMELPWILRDDPVTHPPTIPYLHAARLARTPETELLLARLREGPRRLKVGIAWRASNWNPLRSVPCDELLRALSQLPSSDLYSLQPDSDAELTANGTVVVSDIAADFSNVAGRIASLDVVVTVDGVLAHLAGALGKPVLLLLAFAADWRWGLGETTPWYPKMRLFRQQNAGDWSVPLRQVSEALAHLIPL